MSGAAQLICGFIIGFLICYSGVGGGALVIPAMVVFFDVSPSVAVGTASVYAAVAKIGAGVSHWRDGNINGRLCAMFSLAAVPGVALSAAAVNYYTDSGGESFQEWLRYGIMAAILLALLSAQFRPAAGAAFSRRWLLAAAFVVGAIMGATGVGGGVLIVPVLLLLSGESPKRIVGASIIIALLLSALTALIYAGGGQINYVLAAWMTAGAFLAIIPATAALRRSSQTMVRHTLNIVIVLALLLMVQSAAIFG